MAFEEGVKDRLDYKFENPPKILIVCSAYRQEFVDKLRDGCVAVLDAAGAAHETIYVHGANEIAAAISYAHQSKQKHYDGYVSLGCLMKGDTIHDEVIAYPLYQEIQKLMVDHQLAIGNSVLTVNSDAEALDRADPAKQNRGGEAGHAALQLVSLKQKMGL